jgi:hypothetical protein
MDYMAERWPSLGDLELAQLELTGREYLRPVIRHGAGNTALNRPAGPTIKDKRDDMATTTSSSREVQAA